MNDFPIALRARATWRTVRRTFANAALPAALLTMAISCSDDPTGPSEPTGGTFLLITSVANQSGSDGASFVQTVGLDQPEITNAGAFEQAFRPYPYVNGNDVIVLQGLYGDQAFRYVRGSDGRLTEGGRMSLPPGSVGSGVAFASATKAYVSLSGAGKILIFNPQTMTSIGEIDLTTPGTARNPPNPSDRNPEPVALTVREGKLYATLHQLVTGFASADGSDIAVIDVATNQLEKVIRDPRSAAPGIYGFYRSFFVDEQGDLYVYAGASYGFVAGQKHGILRIRRGQTEFDPSYFVNLADAAVDVPGGKISYLNAPVYAGGGQLYGMALVPALASNPPNYATDRNVRAVRVNLATGTSDGTSGATFERNRIGTGVPQWSDDLRNRHGDRCGPLHVQPRNESGEQRTCCENHRRSVAPDCFPVAARRAATHQPVAVRCSTA